MKHIIASIIAITATSAGAGNLVTEGLADPPVVSPNPPMVTSWGGLYLGGSIGGQRTETTREEHVGYIRECVRAEHGKWAGKCSVSQDDWDHSPELLALGEPVDGHPSRGDLATDFRYDAGYPGVWVADDPVRYTSQSDAPSSQGRYAANNLIGKAFESITESDTDTTYGAFAGYRYQVSDAAYVGAELGAMSGYDALVTAEATASLASGPMLFTASGGFAQMGDLDGTTYGLAADYMVTSNISAGLKAYTADFDDTRTQGVVARVAFNF